MKGVKAFKKGMVCRDYQFKENEEFVHEGGVVPCETGFHYCSEEQALSVLNYYSPLDEFAEVEGTGKVVEHGDKVVTNKLKINSKISLGKVFKIQFDYLQEKIKRVCSESKDANTSGSEAHANTSGSEAHANTSGNCAHANTSGSEAHANTSGYKAHANTSGYKAHANTSGEDSIACSLGLNSKAKAEKGFIIIVDWQYKDKWFINKIHTAKVGQKIKGIKIEPTKWYWFEDGQLKSE